MLYGLRWNYRDAFLFWHDQLPGRKTDLPFVPAASTRPFPIPIGMQRGNGRRQHYDLVVVSDCSLDQAFSTTLEYLIAAARDGRRTAVFHWPLYELASRASLQRELYETCLAYDTGILSPGDCIDAETILFTVPAILQHKIEPLPEIHPRKVVVLVEEQEGGAHSSAGFHYDPLIARSHLQSLYGTEGTWIPASSASANVSDG